MRKLILSLASALLFSAPASATEIASLTNVTSNDAPIGGYYIATSKKTEFTFTITAPPEDDIRFDYLEVVPDGGNYTDNLYLALGCVAYECVEPLDVVFSTNVGERYSVGATVISLNSVNNSVRVDATAVGGAPEPFEWAMMLVGFLIAGTLARTVTVLRAARECQASA